VEGFIGRLRGECLNEEAVTSRAEARAVIARWRCDYNQVRLHSAHGVSPPGPRRTPDYATLTNSAGRPLHRAAKAAMKHEDSHCRRGTEGEQVGGRPMEPRPK
jgi:hypothetical protein